MHKLKFVPIINDEISKLVKELRLENVNLVVVNVNTLWQFLNGEKIDTKNPEMMDVFQKTAELIQENSMTRPIMLLAPPSSLLQDF